MVALGAQPTNLRPYNEKGGSGERTRHGLSRFRMDRFPPGVVAPNRSPVFIPNPSPRLFYILSFSFSFYLLKRNYNNFDGVSERNVANSKRSTVSRLISDSVRYLMNVSLERRNSGRSWQRRKDSRDGNLTQGSVAISIAFEFYAA